MSGMLTTHVLDLLRGKPAEGLRIQLFRWEETTGHVPLDEYRTNADGRVDRPLLAGGELKAGVYELVFWAGEYFRRMAGNSTAEEDPSPFLDRIPVRFRVADAQAHYHVPLLVAPGGYSTYRGS